MPTFYGLLGNICCSCLVRLLLYLESIFSSFHIVKLLLRRSSYTHFISLRIERFYSRVTTYLIVVYQLLPLLGLALAVAWSLKLFIEERDNVVMTMMPSGSGSGEVSSSLWEIAQDLPDNERAPKSHIKTQWNYLFHIGKKKPFGKYNWILYWTVIFRRGHCRLCQTSNS